MAITKVSPDLLDLDAGITISVADNSDNLTLTSTDDDANSGPNLRLYRNSSSPADDDVVGVIDFEGRNNNSQDVIYANIQGEIMQEADGSEDGQLQFGVMKAGTLRNAFVIDRTEVAINEDSVDINFRVESNDSTHMFFVDAGTNKILMSANPASDTQSTPHDILTLATAYSSSGADGAAGLGPRLAFKIPDDEDNPSLGGGIAVVKESGDDSNSSAAMTFATSQNDETLDEAMRITSAGALRINNTSTIGSNDEGVLHLLGEAAHTVCKMKVTTNSQRYIHFFDSSNNHAGEIQNGGGASTVYATSSDYRMKENIKPMEKGLDRVAQLNPVKFTWKHYGIDQEGFIAHEVQEVFPDAVTGEKDGIDKYGKPEMQAMDYGKITPLLVKAIQELTTKLEAAEARITTLEG